MNTFCRILLIPFALAAMPVIAHHSFPAEYDAEKQVSLHGVVTNVEWANPHIFIYMDVPDDSGKLVNWALELGGPNALLRLGWKRDDLKPGEVIDVEGSLARNGKPLVNAEAITMSASGRRMLAGSSRNNSPDSKGAK